MEYYWGAYQADAFELFINWLYRGTLSDILPGKSNDVSEGRNRIIHLYLLADDCGISSLKNLARDRIRAYHLRPSQGFTANDIEKFYFLTKPGSPLRVYIAESYLAALTTWSDASRKLKIEEFLNIEAKGFMVDAWDSVCKAHRKSPFKNSDKEKKCAFHEHADTVVAVIFDRYLEQARCPSLELSVRGKLELDIFLASDI
ncbi:hypothetical protein MMC12_002434 [Toensbergia leucococca]|nr:hypothetical protein [Toensbergia leucococca]